MNKSDTCIVNFYGNTYTIRILGLGNPWSIWYMNNSYISGRGGEKIVKQTLW
jgi:hypothetical protein